MLLKSFICSCKSHWKSNGSLSRIKLGLWMEMKCLRAYLDLLNPSMFQVKTVKLEGQELEAPGDPVSGREASTIKVELSGDSSLKSLPLVVKQ